MAPRSEPTDEAPVVDPDAGTEKELAVLTGIADPDPADFVKLAEPDAADPVADSVPPAPRRGRGIVRVTGGTVTDRARRAAAGAGPVAPGDGTPAE